MAHMPPPLSWNLKDSPAVDSYTNEPGFIFGEGGQNLIRPAFQSLITLAVLLPESFRGGCSFGVSDWSFGISS